MFYLAYSSRLLVTCLLKNSKAGCSRGELMYGSLISWKSSPKLASQAMWAIVFQGIASCHQPGWFGIDFQRFTPTILCCVVRVLASNSDLVSIHVSSGLRTLHWWKTDWGHLSHIFILRRSLGVELVTMACHPPLQPVLGDVLPVPVV